MSNAVSIAQSGANNVTFRNRIINGNMMIDQRNNGASVTPANGAYTLDRWRAEQTGGGVYTVQQSSTAPAGYKNSLLVTVTTADSSIAAGDYYDIEQFIEGFNIADLAWGTASAATVTLSFWVRSSVTGTFAGSLVNSDNNRSYVFTYTINSANTFEQKTVTIAGDTSGTWLTTNGRGIGVFFDLGNGSSYQTTAGSWVSSYAVGTSSSVKLISTINATFYITGVQLEKGSTATPFEQRLYGTELSLCQRYYEVTTYDPSTYALMSAPLNVFTNQWHMFNYKQTKRAVPTFTLVSGVWSGATPTIQPGIDKCTFNNGSTYFYSAGSSGSVAGSFSAEL